MTQNTKDAGATQTLAEQAETLQRVYDLVGMGALARTPSILLTNLENMKRRSDCLSGIEQLFTYEVPDDDMPDEMIDECDLNWGQCRAEYVETFKAALPAFIARHPEYAPTAEQAEGVPQIKPRLLNQLRRFNECCEDSEAGGHDVDKEDMHSLAELGAVRPAPGGRHYMTDFGHYLLAAPQPSQPVEAGEQKYDPRDPGNWRDGDDACGNAAAVVLDDERVSGLTDGLRSALEWAIQASCFEATIEASAARGELEAILARTGENESEALDIAERLEEISERITRFSNLTGDGIAARAAQLLREFAAKSLVYTAPPVHTANVAQDECRDAFDVMHRRAMNAEANVRELVSQARAASPQATATQPAQTALTVWYGTMPESNGKTNYTAILHKGDVTSGITLDMSEYPDRVRYEADRMRWMIGELDKEPFILDYDADKHSGYVAPLPAQTERAAEYRVGWFKSSSNPRKRVRCLFEGDGIAEAEKHHSFIEWCDAYNLPAAAQPASDRSAHD
jgi:hypothetical protein